MLEVHVLLCIPMIRDEDTLSEAVQLCIAHSLI